ncbi:MAG: hypothetical protein M3O35_11770 [Acidobacteriota bacterium]|nr:hypothetical protein [Acidobacteriota bacterium]
MFRTRPAIPLFALALAGAGCGWAQAIVDPEVTPRVSPAFGEIQNKTPLEGQVRLLKPHLNFGFRFQVGYAASLPYRQFAASRQRLGVALRITPKDSGEPVYFVQAVPLPPRIPEGTKEKLDIEGGFQVGEGRYTVEWALFDESGRCLRKQWEIEARSPGRNVRVAQPPGKISPLALNPGEILKPRDASARPLRVTVLLHVAPLYTRSTRLRSFDRFLLLSSLVWLLEESPFTSVKLVAFNLDQQKEIYRQENFDGPGYGRLASAMANIELGTVPIETLRRRTGHIDMLARMLNEERTAAEPADAILFVGPGARQFDKFPPSMIAAANAPAPKVFYFEYFPYWGRHAEFPDSIDHATRAVAGKTWHIHSPSELADAVRSLARELGLQQSSAADQ